jgi:hypothetical protein
MQDQSLSIPMTSCLIKNIIKNIVNYSSKEAYLVTKQN